MEGRGGGERVEGRGWRGGGGGCGHNEYILTSTKLALM